MYDPNLPTTFDYRDGERPTTPVLKTCPFCNSMPDVFEDGEIQCGNKKCPVRPSARWGGAEVWNTRTAASPPPTPSDAAMRAAEEICKYLYNQGREQQIAAIITRHLAATETSATTMGHSRNLNAFCLACNEHPCALIATSNATEEIDDDLPARIWIAPTTLRKRDGRIYIAPGRKDNEIEYRRVPPMTATAEPDIYDAVAELRKTTNCCTYCNEVIKETVPGTWTHVRTGLSTCQDKTSKREGVFHATPAAATTSPETPVGGEWLPIATVPKNGDEVLLAHANSQWLDQWISDITGDYAEGGYWMMCDQWTDPETPTHWKPLSPLPNAVIFAAALRTQEGEGK